MSGKGPPCPFRGTIRFLSAGRGAISDAMGSISDEAFGGAATAASNLLHLPCGAREEEERFEDIVRRPGVRIERILSRGHTTPPDRPYVQSWDEWVLILSGSAELFLEGLGSRRLAAGEHLLIPAGVPHLVTCTDDPTIWLAVHIGEPPAGAGT